MEFHRGVCSAQDPFGVILDSSLPTNLTHVPFTHRQTTYAYSQPETTSALSSSPFKVRSHCYNFLYPSFKLFHLARGAQEPCPQPEPPSPVATGLSSAPSAISSPTPMFQTWLTSAVSHASEAGGSTAEAGAVDGAHASTANTSPSTTPMLTLTLISS